MVSTIVGFVKYERIKKRLEKVEVDELSIEGLVEFTSHLEDKESVEMAEQMKKGDYKNFLCFSYL